MQKKENGGTGQSEVGPKINAQNAQDIMRQLLEKKNQVIKFDSIKESLTMRIQPLQNDKNPHE